MSSLQTAFPYRPLSESSFGATETRLIYLHPGDFDDSIYCTVYHADILQRRPETEYTALSYVWGDAKRKNSIQLGYHQLSSSGTASTRASAPSPEADCYTSFGVTTNLEKALRHLRDRVSGRIHWVDAICINQSDWEECLSQVQRMGTVYEQALEVRIWLGSVSDICNFTPDLQENDANDLLRGVQMDGKSYSRLSPEEVAGAALSSDKSIIERALLAAVDYVKDNDRLIDREDDHVRLPDELQALGIRIIAMQPWWRRVWVIQEATMPEEDPVMQCGYMQVRYRRFLEVAKRCMLQDPPSLLPRTHISLIVHDTFHKKYEPSEKSSASQLLTYLSCMSGNFEVSKPKDRVNGVYGKFRMYGPHDNIMLFIMYDQQEQTDTVFFHRVAVWILFDAHPSSRPLRILESGPSDIQGIPSWVPMWESKQWSGEDKIDGAPGSDYDILAQGKSMGKKYHRPLVSLRDEYNAQYKREWGAPKASPDIDVRCTVLRIHNALALGRVITTVEVPSLQKCKDADVLRRAVLEVEDRILAVLRSMDIPHADAKTHTRRFRDYIRLNFWDSDKANRPSSPEHSATTLNEFLQCESKSRKRKSQRGRRRAVAHQEDSCIPSLSSIAKLTSFFEHTRHLMVGSGIVGHMYEDSLPSWRCGDRLYLIPECRWALGLRRSGNAYRYMYRVFISDLAWQQRKQLFDGKGSYESILLV